jgi:hypothetical protein
MAEISMQELEQLVRLKDRTQLWWNLPRVGTAAMRSIRLTIQSDLPPRLRVEEIVDGAQVVRDVVVEVETLFTLVPLLLRALAALEGEQ